MSAPSLPPPPDRALAARLSQWIGRSSKLPLSALLIVPFVLQIVGAVGLVSWLSYRNGEKAVHDLSSQLRNELIARIEQQIQTYIEIPYSINSINANAITRHDLDVVNPKGEYQLWQQAKIFPATNLIYCGSEHGGELLGVGRSTLERELQLVLYNQQLTNRFGYYYNLDESGNRAELLRKGSKPYDARTRPWYKAAKSTGQPTWSEIYLDFDTQLPTITASQPVYTTNGKLLGVCATDFLLPVELTEFLNTLKIGKSGETFIIDRAGTLVSSSTQESIALTTGDKPRLRQAVESQDDVIRETATYLRQHFGSFEAIEQAQQLDFPIQGERHFLQVTPFKDNRGLDWLIVVAVPESNFMAQIHANTRTTLWLSELALLGAISIGILTTRWITRPILRTTQASGEMANGNLDQHVQASPIGELNQLADAFNGMAEQLKQSFTALNQSEVRNRALLQAIPDLIMEVSADGVYLDCVEAKGDNWLVTKPEDRIGRRVQDILPTMAALQYLQAIQLALQTREAQTLEYEVAIRGTMRSYEARVVPMHEASALLIVREITDRKLAESALRQSEATNRALVAAIPDLLIRATGNGTYLDISGRDRLTLQNELRFAPGSTVYDSLPPDKAEQRMRAIRQALQTGDMQIYEQSFVLNGQAQYEEVRVVVSGDNEVLIMVRDITARKQAEESLRIAEENYRSIFENALEGIFQSTPDGRYLRINPALARMHGYYSPEEMLQSVTAISHQIYVNPVQRETFKRQMEQHGEVKGFEYEAYRRDGSIMWVSENTRAVQDESRRVLYYEGIVEDITERKLREEELKRQLQELRIEIDQKKLEWEVTLITQSRYFQELQEEVSEVNLDEFWG